MDKTNYSHTCNEDQLCADCGWRGCICETISHTNYSSTSTNYLSICPACGTIITTSVMTVSDTAKPSNIGAMDILYTTKVEEIIEGYGFIKVSDKDGRKVFDLNDGSFFITYFEKDRLLTISAERAILASRYIIYSEENLRYLISCNVQLIPHIK